MRASAFARAVVESTVRRAIRRIAEDPERGLRNLVDMGVATATGRFQQHYMKIVQGVLEDEACPYYEMVCRTARETSERNLTTFGVNMGWQSWTEGAKRIRAYEAANGRDVPWCLTLHMEDGAETVDWAGLVRAGQSCGIWTHFLHVGRDRDAMEAACRLAGGEPRCAFLLFTAPESVPGAMDELAELDNVMTVVDASDPLWREAVACLREERRLYGLFRPCGSDGDAAGAEAWLEEIQDVGALAAFLLPGPGCTEAGRETLARLTEEAWTRRRWPLLVFDYYRDILLVDEIISDGPCFAGVLPDGRTTGYRGGAEIPLGENLRERPLSQALRRRGAMKSI